MKKVELRDTSLIRIQWVCWICVFLLLIVSYLITDYPLKVRALYSSINNVLCWAIIIYGNMLFLMPKFYQRHKIGSYILASFLLILLVSVYRVEFRTFMMQLFFPGTVDQSSTLQVYIAVIIPSLMAFFFSFLLKMALDYFRVRKEKEMLEQYTAEVELNLLKSQVQPHFLFNTLNNIYYVAQAESPETAQLLAKLSNIMRYFVDEAPKKEILLATDVQFVLDYIALERIRLRYAMKVEIQIVGDTQTVNIPPMLIIPLVENVFKHGIDRRGLNNLLRLNLTVNNCELHVEITNRIVSSQIPATSHSGLKNLCTRLKLLYGESFQFEKKESDGHFIVNLIIPLQR